MGDVSKGEGRTVLFVSHNMASVSSLCSTGIYMKNGTLIGQGKIQNIIAQYLSDGLNENTDSIWEGDVGDEYIKITKTKIYTVDDMNGFHTDTDLFVEITGEVLQPIYGLILGFTLISQYGYEIAYTLYDDEGIDIDTIQPGKFTKKFKIPANNLAEGHYKIEFDIGIHNVKRIIKNECNISFQLANISGIGRKFIVGSQQGRTSLFRPDWSVIE